MSSYTRQELLDIINTATWGTVNINYQNNIVEATLDEDIVYKLNEKYGNFLARFAKENTLDDSNNLRVFDVVNLGWISIPIDSISEVKWTEQPDGPARWE
jgi:hypothetical protein